MKTGSPVSVISVPPGMMTLALGVEGRNTPRLFLAGRLPVFTGSISAKYFVSFCHRFYGRWS
jgi:hypothetical protein